MLQQKLVIGKDAAAAEGWKQQKANYEAKMIKVKSNRAKLKTKIEQTCKSRFKESDFLWEKHLQINFNILSIKYEK